MQRNLANGILLPRWAPDLGNGYGQPVFVFRPPFFYAIAEAWRLLGQDVVTAVNLACALLVLAAAVAMFLLGRLYFGETGGWLAAAAYLYAPYFAVDLYVRSALEEFAAFPLFPLALYGFGAFARSGRRRYWILGACAYAAVLCCHFPAALLFTPVLLGFLAVTAWSARSWRMLAEQGGGLALAAGMSAWSWLPAIAEKQYVAMGRVLEGNFQYALHFVYLHQLFDPAWGYGLSLPGPNDGMSFSLGWSHVLVAVAACVWVARHRNTPIACPCVSSPRRAWRLCALMLPDAVWIWDHAPLLPYVEFPWRLLGPATLCLAILAAGLAPMLDSLRAWRRPAAIAAALALLIVPNLPHLRAAANRRCRPRLLDAARARRARLREHDTGRGHSALDDRRAAIRAARGRGRVGRCSHAGDRTHSVLMVGESSGADGKPRADVDRVLSGLERSRRWTSYGGDPGARQRAGRVRGARPEITQWK